MLEECLDFHRIVACDLELMKPTDAKNELSSVYQALGARRRLVNAELLMSS